MGEAPFFSFIPREGAALFNFADKNYASVRLYFYIYPSIRNKIEARVIQWG